MKKIFSFTTFILISTSLFYFFGCRNDNEEELYPSVGQSNCDTANVTYSLTIATIMQSKCISCHNGSSSGGDLSLQNYNEVSQAVNSRSLYSKITNASDPMPPGGMMDACKIKQIKKWIDSGLPNN